MSSEHILILGGARSGKSAHGERLALGTGARPAYLATSQAFDAEMAARIAKHRADRDGRFTTIEEPLELVAALENAAQAHDVVLVDCLTLWISNLMAAGEDVAAASDALAGFVQVHRRSRIILISNEVGLGIVPDNAAARDFRDHAGRLHQVIAAAVPHVVFVAAGLALTMKGDPPDPGAGPTR